MSFSLSLSSVSLYPPLFSRDATLSVVDAGDPMDGAGYGGLS